MKAAFTVAIPLAILMALGGCNRGTYADVVRFHTNQPINRGTLFVQAADPSTAGSLEFRTHAESVAVEMRRQGFTTVPDIANAQYLAVLDIAQTDGQTTTRPGATAGIPAGAAIIAIPVGGGPRSTSDRTTTVAVQIRRQTDGAQIWEGRASRTGRAGSQDATLTAVVPVLAGALFGDFPGPAGETRQVRI